MTHPITYHNALIQGSAEWLEARRGILTASEACNIITPTLKVANNDKTRQHVYEMAAQRISGFVEPTFVGEDMLRGQVEEVLARQAYEDRFGPVAECGFITNSRHGFVIGCSPDGLVGQKGQLEIKSRRQKYQVRTVVLNHSGSEPIPADYLIQCQFALLVTEREWLDFISYSNGLPMAVFRAFPDAKVHSAMLEAVEEFEASVSKVISDYSAALKSWPVVIETERRLETEMYL